MKTDSNLRKIRGAAFAALTLGVLSLLGGCAADENNSGTGKGAAQLAINVGGINDAVDSTGTRALPLPETVSQVQADGTVLDFTLTPVAPSSTRASSAMTSGNTYKYVVLDGSNNVVGAVDGQAGTVTAAISIPDVSQAYTIAAYSYNNTAAMPSPGAVGATAGSVAGPVNTDVLYFKESLAGGTLVANSSTTRAVTFDHKYSRVTVVVDATSLAANVTSVGTVTLEPSYASTLNVATGAVAKTGTSTPATVTFGTLGTQTVTSDPAVLFTNGETPLTLSFSALTIGSVVTNASKSVTFSRALQPGTAYTLTVSAHLTIPATITLAQNQYYFVASVNDDHYLPYTAPTVAATTATGVNPSGGTTDPLVNVQGSISSTTGVTVKIPVAVSSGTPTLPAYSTTITIPSSLTEDGISRNLTLSWAAQALSTTSKTITATIKAVGGTLNAKKLDINAGLGNDILGVLMGQFSYPSSSAGTSILQVRDISGIPDRMFGKADNNGSTDTHLMLYVPIVAEDGKVWLSNNLGADYTNIKKTTIFNPLQQATVKNDFKAYGSLFQWGRKPDGHELMTWTSGTAGSSVYISDNNVNRVDDPTIPNFLDADYTGDWRANPDGSLWANENSANNPCPSGFRVPTLAELQALVTAAGLTNLTAAAGSILKFSAAGNRNAYNGTMYGGVSTQGYYWTSSPTGNLSYQIYFIPAYNYWQTGRGYGFSVRCIKN